MTRPHTKPQTPGPVPPRDTSQHRDGTDPQHVARTGLPPGVSIDDVKDPGNAATNKTPVDNRS